jgi:hypothetical protein
MPRELFAVPTFGFPKLNHALVMDLVYAETNVGVGGGRSGLFCLYGEKGEEQV